MSAPMTYEEDLASREDEDGGITPADQIEAAVNELARIVATPGFDSEIACRLSQVADDLSLLSECV